MKIMLVNYRFFISGGPERYYFNLKELLESKGHIIIPFSVRHELNKPTKYSKFFLSPIGSGNETYFSEYNLKKFKNLFKIFSRMFYSFEAKKKFDRLIKKTNPDLIFIIHFANKISYSIIDAAINNNIPILYRISDFGYICASSLFYLSEKRGICEKCLKESNLNAIKNKCVYNSYLYSFIKVLSLKLQHSTNLHTKINKFLVPSKFTQNKMIEFGINKEKFEYLPTFVNENLLNNKNIEYHDFALYIGRIEPEKGLLTMVKAFINTNYKLTIIGFSQSKYDLFLKTYLKDKNHNISFVEKLPFEKIKNYLRTCLFTIVPSECYDNFPNSIIESFAFKKPVIVSKIGSLIEPVENYKTGLVFELKDHDDLKEKINILFNNIILVKKLGENSYKKLIKNYSPEVHYKKLMKTINNIIT